MAGLDVIDERQAHYDDEREEQQRADGESEFGQDAQVSIVRQDVHVSIFLFIFLTLLPSQDENKRENYGL